MRPIGISRAPLSMGCSRDARKRHARSEEFGCAVPDATFARAEEYEDGWTLLAGDARASRGSIHRVDREGFARVARESHVERLYCLRPVVARTSRFNALRNADAGSRVAI
jgi:hypothetical protein